MYGIWGWLRSYMWTSIVEVCNSIWRQKGLLVYVYFDDILVLGDDPCACAAARDLVLQTLRDAGLCVNLAKSVLDPTQLVHYLGVSINFALGQLEIPQAKRREYRREIGKLVVKDAMSLRQGACILGKVRSLLVVFPALRCCTDALVTWVQSAHVYGYNFISVVPESVRRQARYSDVKLLWAIGPVGRLIAPSQGTLLAMRRIMS